MPENYDPVLLKLNELCELLQKNPAMEANEPGKPAKDKNKVYFMWEFADRTRTILEKATPAQLRPNQDAWIDVHGRSFLIYQLMVEDPEKLEAMCKAGTTGHSFTEQEKQAATDLWKALR